MNARTRNGLILSIGTALAGAFMLASKPDALPQKPVTPRSDTEALMRCIEDNPRFGLNKDGAPGLICDSLR